MCVLWFNNYGLKIPFFRKKKIFQKKKSWSWAHKITKISTFIPPPSYYFQILAKIPGNQLKLNWNPLLDNTKLLLLDLNFPCKILSSAKYHPKTKKSLKILNQKFFVESKITATKFWRFVHFFSLCSGWDYNISYDPPVKRRANIFGSGNPGEKFPDKFWASLKWFFPCQDSDFARFWAANFPPKIFFLLCIFTNGILSINEYLLY